VLLNIDFNGSKKWSEKILFETIITMALNLPPNSNSKFLYISLLVKCCEDDILGANIITNLNILMKNIMEKGFQYNPNSIDTIISIYGQMKTNNVDLKWDWVTDNNNQQDRNWISYIVKEILREMMILTHYEKFQEEGFMEVCDYLPDQPKLNFDLDHHSNALYSDYQVLLDKFNSKLDSVEMKAFLDSNDIIQISGSELNSLFYNVFFKKSSMSLTHLKTYVERYRVLLTQMLLGNENEQASF